MLRAAVAVIGICLLLAGLVLVVVPPHAGWGLLVFGSLVVLSLLFEGRYRGQRTAAPQPPSWQPTGEKFIDPGTGQTVEVDYDPETGERNYRQT
ncbi:MAG TPA: PGPGW domain-containing protein [Candidatus Baltobacteraceae bacterium]|nr:PGPGW domain-containing protein [Candidatus Baltobacteraceae bacterium]